MSNYIMVTKLTKEGFGVKTLIKASRVVAANEDAEQNCWIEYAASNNQPAKMKVSNSIEELHAMLEGEEYKPF